MVSGIQGRRHALMVAVLVGLCACEFFIHKPSFDGGVDGDLGEVGDLIDTSDPGEEGREDLAEDSADVPGDELEAIDMSCEGLVLLMHFDRIEANGETETFVRDYSGAGNDGIVRDALFGAGEGRFGGAYTFDGDADAVVVSDSDSLDLTGAVTLAAWIYPTGDTGFNYVITKATQVEGYPYIHYAFGWDSSSTNLRFVVSSETQYQIITDPLAMDRWYLVVGTFDLAEPGLNMKLYVDGELVSSRTVSEAIVTNERDVLIGAYEWFTGETWIGRIDEVAIFNRALVETEVAALYGSNAPIPCDRVP